MTAAAKQAEPPRGDGPVRLLYVAGYGHSGSTLLNIILDQHPAVMGAGELFRLHEAWTRNEFCSCGAPLPQCPVWEQIMRDWAEAVGGGDVAARYARLQAMVERILPARLDGSAWQDYAAFSRRLCQAIAGVTGARAVVDASKLPQRGRALGAVEGIDLRVVHLVRDGRGVAYSLGKRHAKDVRAGIQAEKRKRSVLRTAALWSFTNLRTEQLVRRVEEGRGIRVNYEDLVTEPRPTLRRLGEILGLDLGGVADDLLAGRPLAVGHVMAGNRMRMSKGLPIRPDFEWQHGMAASERRMLGWLCQPLLGRYGYGR